MPEERVNVAMRTLTSAFPRVLCVYIGGGESNDQIPHRFFLFYKEVLSDALCINDLIHDVLLLPVCLKGYFPAWSVQQKRQKEP